MLNKLSNEEAIEIVINHRKSIDFDLSDSCAGRWLTKDALAQVINLATERAKEIENEKRNCNRE